MVEDLWRSVGPVGVALTAGGLQVRARPFSQRLIEAVAAGAHRVVKACRPVRLRLAVVVQIGGLRQALTAADQVRLVDQTYHGVGAAPGARPRGALSIVLAFATRRLAHPAGARFCPQPVDHGSPVAPTGAAHPIPPAGLGGGKRWEGMEGQGK